MSVLSGLGDLGLSNLEGADLFASEEKKPVSGSNGEPQKKQHGIEEYVFEKTYTCPVCDSKFMNPTVKNGKTKMVGQDFDLRGKYEPIDPTKYDVIVCPECGYAALSRYFDKIMPPQAKQVREEISKSFKNTMNNGPDLSYDDAIARYQLALANAVVKRAKDSEKAYICWKLTWVVRAKREELDMNLPDYERQEKELLKDEIELMTNALGGFINARQKEDFPISGMDENTLDYVISAIAVKIGKYDIARKLLPGILTSRSANDRIKDKARDLKDLIAQNKQK